MVNNNNDNNGRFLLRFAHHRRLLAECEEHLHYCNMWHTMYLKCQIATVYLQWCTCNGIFLPIEIITS